MNPLYKQSAYPHPNANPLHPGLTKLELFTMAAMQGLSMQPIPNDSVAAHAIDIAKLTLDALEKEVESEQGESVTP